MDIFTIIGLLVAGIIIYFIGLYNTLVKKNVQSEEAWADIDVQLKRRYDLVPNLVETVKGYAKHEQETLSAVIEARSQASSMNIDAANISAEDMAVMSGLQGGLSKGIGKIFALAEAYPDLKANENFSSLQGELSDIEDKIQAARRFYNGTIRDLNILIKSFPSNIAASALGFTTKEFFELEENSPEKEVVKVSF